MALLEQLQQMFFTKHQLDSLVNDQRFIVDSINKMQMHLIKMEIIDETDRK